MKTHPKARSIIAAMVALSLVGSGSAWAGKKNDRHDYGYNQGGNHGKHYSYNKHRKYKHRPNYYYGGGHKNPYNRWYGGNYYNYEDDDSDEKLLIGLLVGGLVGYAINGAQSDNSSGYDSYPPPVQQGSAATCLQEREYQMKVIVGGREVDAYGTACLQPDGSWSRGPAQLVSR